MNIEFNEPPKKEGFEDMNFRLYNLNKENNPNDIFSHLFVFPEQNNYSLVWLGQIDFNDLEKIALGKIPTYQRQRRFFKDFYLNITRNLMQKTLLGTKLIKDEFDNLDYKNGDIQCKKTAKGRIIVLKELRKIKRGQAKERPYCFNLP